jgi:aromatic-amino-acid transaminase
MSTLFDNLAPGPLDPILLSFQAFMADPRPEKANLGVGMYYDDQGRIPLMRAVAEAEKRIAAAATPWGYLMSEGLPGFRTAVGALLLGQALLEQAGPRLATIQTLGGTGALRLGAEVVQRLAPDAAIAVSRPSWGNHHTTFQAAGCRTVEYPYFDAAAHEVDFTAMRDAIAALPTGTVVLLQACCHNPTGADLSPAQWQQLAALLKERALVPFLDYAYGGFGDGLEQDAAAIRLMAAEGLPLLVATSFSKSFSLYGERVGALSVIAETPAQAALLIETMKAITRNMYSTPPTHGALLVQTVMNSPELQADWKAELEEMRLRILSMRQALCDRLAGNGPPHGFGFFLKQKGLFSFSGLSAEQVARLRDDFAVHAVQDGRLCMAAVNPGNLERVAAGLRSVSVDAGA